MTEVHDGYPVLADDFADDGSVSGEAMALHGEEDGDQHPFLQVFSFIHAAEGERLIGDHTRALVDLNTAVELLIRFVLYYGDALTGVPEDEARRANKATLKAKVTKFLPALLQREIDIEDTTNPWGAWFKDGYMLRNRAIHEGELLDYNSVERAFAQAGALIADLQRSLEAVEPLARLGRAIGLEPRGPGERVVDDSLGIEFPWD